MEETGTWKEWIPLLLDPDNEEALYLQSSVRKSITEILNEAQGEMCLEDVIEAAHSKIPAQGIHPAAHSLMGLANLRLQNIPEATSQLTSVCNRLEKERRWDALVWVAEQFFQETQSLKATRFLIKVAEEAGLSALSEGVLDSIYEVFPDEYRLAYLKAQQAKEAENVEQYRRYLLQSLQGFLQTYRAERIEEIYLELVGSVDDDTHQRLFRGAIRLAKKKWDIAEPLLDLLLPHFKTSELARMGWDTFLEMLVRIPSATTTLRRFLRTMAPLAFPEVDDVDSVLMQSGLFDERTKPETAVQNLKALLDLAPGYYVLHAGWGVGKITSNDGEYLVIDFLPNKPNHRMGLQLSLRALEVLPHDDLRVLALARPEKLERLVREEPEQMIFLALREAGGQATTTVLRKRLNDTVAKVKSWATWWKETKPRLENHPRIDLSLSFRNTYRIIEGLGGEEEVPLPSLDRKRGIRTNLNLIRRFLEQHPGLKTSSSHIHGPILKQWVKDERTHSEDRVALHLFLETELDTQESGKDDAIRMALEEGLEPADISEAVHQLSILDAGFSHKDSKTDAILFGLASRHRPVREKAIAALCENSEEGKSLLVDLLRNPGRRPVAALALIQHSVNASDDDPFWPDPWEAAFGAALLADITTRDMLRRQAVSILDPKGALAQKAQGTQPSEDVASRWSYFLKRWRSSERALFHVYAFLSTAGLEEVVEEVKHIRDAATNRALSGDEEKIEISGIPMTQLTYERLIEERDQTALALRTSIPEAIKKAREMGDLRENAEYDAAKHKQAQETGRLGSLNRQIQQAEIIEDLTLPDGIAGPGTEIVLEETTSGTRQTHWILGKGDNHLGEHVISVMAPLGQAALGQSAGDDIEVKDQEGDEIHRYRLIEVRRRLP